MTTPPSRPFVPREFPDVFREELDLIASRRKAAIPRNEDQLLADRLVNVDAEKLQHELVGLALSGGGVRSAAFNLGLLQAFHEHDSLRQVDYLSTVSGGGYVGSHLSSLAMHPQAKFDWECDKLAQQSGPRATATDCPQEFGAKAQSKFDETVNPVHATLGAGHRGLAAEAVKRIAKRCRYLANPSHFLNRQLIGAVCLNAVTLSGLLALAAIVAWGFRTLDGRETMWFLDAAGVRGDISRAMLPSVLLFGGWLLAWMLAFFRDRDKAHGHVAKILLMLWLIATLLGIASLAGLGDVGIAEHTKQSRSLAPNIDRQVTDWFGKLGYAALIAIGGALLPYLSPKALLRSATVNRRGISGLIYRTSTWAMLFGVPLVLFWYMSQEDVSGWNNQRTAPIVLPGIGVIKDADESSTAKTADVTTSPSMMPAAKLVLSNLGVMDDPQALKKRVQDHLTAIGIQSNDLTYLEKYDLRYSIRSPAEFWSQVERCSAVEGLGRGWFLPFRQEQRSHAAELTATLHHDQLLPPSLAQKFQNTANGVFKRITHDPRTLEEKYRRVEKKESLWSLVGGSLLYLFTGYDDTYFGYQWERKRQFTEGWDELAKAISAEVLADVNMSSYVANSAALTEDILKTNPKAADLRPLLVKAESLKSELTRLLLAIRQTELQSTSGTRASPTSVEAALVTVLRVDPRNLKVDRFDERRASAMKLVKLCEQVRQTNREILQSLCPEHITLPDTIFASVVQEHDQEHRLWMAGCMGSTWLVLSMLVSLNAISIQGVYRDALSRAWIVDATQQNGESQTLGELVAAAKRGCPYHLVTGAMSFGASWDFEPTGTPFLFSPLYCGSESTGYVPSTRYQNGTMTLSDAMGISGAAVAPPQVTDPLGRTLLILANFRMGTWLPNPLKGCWHLDAHSLPWIQRMAIQFWSEYPQTPGRVYLQWFLWQWFFPERQTSFVYVSDGGHHENLAIEELLKRRCRLIILSDAAEDSKYSFSDFINAAHRLSSQVRFERLDCAERDAILDPAKTGLFEPLIPQANTGYTAKHFIVLRIKYLSDLPESESQTGYLIYIKPTLTGDEDPGLLGFRTLSPEFPHDPTSNQLFEDDKFEAYRRLGYHIGCELSTFARGAKSDSSWLGNWNPPAEIIGAAVHPKVGGATSDPEMLTLLEIAEDSRADVLERWFAMRELADLGEKHAWPVLLRLLKDPKRQVAFVAFLTLWRLSQGGADVGIAALNSPHLRVQLECLRLMRETLHQNTSQQFFSGAHGDFFTATLSLFRLPRVTGLSKIEERLWTEALKLLDVFAARGFSESFRKPFERQMFAVSSCESIPQQVRDLADVLRSRL